MLALHLFGGAMPVWSETIYSQTAAGGSRQVMPYPTGDSVINWITNEGPGTQAQPFTVPGRNYLLNSVTLQMSDATSTLGGFSVSLRTLNTGATTSLSLVEALSGSSNPSTAGSYTYTGSGLVPLAANSSFWVLAEVGTGGGTYLWDKSTTGVGQTLILANGPASPTLNGPLDLNDVVIFIDSGSGGLMFSVDATLIDVEGGLQFANAQGQALLAGGQTVLGDLNNHLFNLRAGGGEESSDGSIASSLDEGVIEGQGDGPENPIAKRVRRSRQWEVFTTVNYGNVNLNAVGGQAGVKVDSWAPGLGIERHLSRGLTLGFAVSFLSSHQSYTGGLGSLDLEGPALSAYLSFVRRNFWSDLLYSFGAYEFDTARNPGPGIPTANGSTRAYTNAIQYNTGWNFRFQNNTLVTGPFAGIDWLHGSLDGYSETGGGLAALRYARQSFESLVTRVGWSVSKRLKTDWATITPQVRLSYERQHLSNNGTSVSAINAPFSAAGGNQSPGQDYMVAGSGVNFEFSPAFSMLLTYQGQFFRSDMQAHFGGVRFSYKF
ncbi:autotransporter outer membrane beta-barrel domain-containing protein [Prosthecobacter sp.]|uniref:autotransporter family protein n=1 Tax=Prosthecobacter sp. TaxID=1965333 RepID=UPI002AB893A7|nr:autotransporter outer membrane beta-barrel domain-containing protein [Prosthecobacter sp.]MDZ4403714.1 autotransporter outer membrane beta-barrel domain-containing protein [Prosthecobacter sp.]